MRDKPKGKQQRIPHVVLGNQGEECAERLREVGSDRVCQSGYEVASRGDEDRVVLCLIFRGFLFGILVGILLAECFLLENLNCDVADFVQIYRMKN